MLSDQELPLRAIQFYNKNWDWFKNIPQNYPNAIPIQSTITKELEKEELENEFERD